MLSHVVFHQQKKQRGKSLLTESFTWLIDKSIFTNFTLSQITSFNIKLLEMLIQMKLDQLFSRQSSFSSQ